MKINIGIFFDGTGNDRSADASKGTLSNIGKLSQLYRESKSENCLSKSLYVRGVGTKGAEGDDVPDDFDEWTLFGAAFGSGGKARIEYILTKLKNAVKNQDGEIILDVFGFSRGAALARSFVNVISDKQHEHDALKSRQIIFRFLGIYDTVGSFGYPGNDVDLYNFHVDNSKVNYIYHITSQDELRKNFDLQSIKRAPTEVLNFPLEPQTNWMVEEAVPGVHSDVGGGYSPKLFEQGNNNNELSRLYLQKMHSRAVRQKVPFNALHELPSEEYWEVLPLLRQEFSTLMGYFADDVRLLRFYQPLKNAQRQEDIMDRKLSSVSQSKRLAKLRQRINARIAALKALIQKDCFEDDKAAAEQFFLLAETFHKKYIHKSHSPWNKTPGMGVQKAMRDRSQDFERFVSRDKKASKLDTVLSREVFYNIDDQPTAFIERIDSLKCFVKIVLKNDPGDTLPPGVEIEVWDDDLTWDDIFGFGVTNDMGVAEILCFNVDGDQDLYFEVDSNNVKFNSGKPLPANWSSRESDSMKVGSAYEEGILNNHNGKDIGSKQNPLILYVD